VRKLSTVFLILTLLAGVGFFVYPDVASWWNGRIQAGVVDTYQRDVAAMQQSNLETHLQYAIAFNNAITEINISDPFADAEAMPVEYTRILRVNGIMATIEVPSVNINLPVRHGTSSAVLDIGAGHLHGTSLPVGGAGTHAVITAHSGFSNTRLFTDLLDGRVTYGDFFFVNVLGQRLTYRVDQINQVTPYDTSHIYINPEMDFVTLITCTPLGVNSHRLLIRGVRVPDEEAVYIVIEDIAPAISVWETNWRFITTIGAFLLFIIIFASYQLSRIIGGWLKKKRGGYDQPDPELIFEDDPYVAIPATQNSQTRVALHPKRKGSTTKYNTKYSDALRRRVMLCIALLILLTGAGIALYPQVQRALFVRYSEALIDDWFTELEEVTHFIQRRWVNARVALWSDVSDLRIASVNGGQLELTPEGEVILGNLNFTNVDELTVGQDGYLTLGGLPLGSNGYITVADMAVPFIEGDLTPVPYQPGLYVSQNGNLYISVGGGLYISNNGGNVSLGDLNLGPSGGVYIGGHNLGNLTIDNFDEYAHDLDFIFNFDLDTDPMYWLNTQMEDYNHDLYDDNQSELNTLEDAEEVDFSISQLAGFREEMLGIIVIPDLNIRLPIFAGSGPLNLMRGAGHMTQTSLPVGGIGTNAVITAHSGLTQARMFCNLVSSKGDGTLIGTLVHIHNPYQELTYRIYGYTEVGRTLNAIEMSYIKIQEGRDMITLLTCYPYRVNSHRLLVFAERYPTSP